MSHHIVEVKNLRHVYADGTTALQDVSFRIHHGESVAIIGANGAGKSTLLQHLNGYLLPTSGEIRIGDFPLMKSTLPEIRRTVGIVFQDPDDQLFMPTVYDDVAFGPLNLGLTGSAIDERVQDCLNQVGAAHLKDKPPYHLSGGEKKRVAIATVLAMSPDILVMDEPTNGLDPFARRRLLMLLKEFHHTKIFTSHDLDMVLDLCERTIILHEGLVKADGPTLEIFQNEALLASCRLERPLSLQGCPVCGAGTTRLVKVKAATKLDQADHGDNEHEHLHAHLHVHGHGHRHDTPHVEHDHLHGSSDSGHSHGSGHSHPHPHPHPHPHDHEH